MSMVRCSTGSGAITGRRESLFYGGNTTSTALVEYGMPIGSVQDPAAICPLHVGYSTRH